jgi:hypothetical protein
MYDLLNPRIKGEEVMTVAACMESGRVGISKAGLRARGRGVCNGQVAQD